MTTLTIPYTLEDDNGAIAPDYKRDASFELESFVDLFDDMEADSIEDDEIREGILENVREDFSEKISPVVGETALADLVKQVREALVKRDCCQPTGAS